MSKSAFKIVVKDRIRKLAFNTLMKEKADKSKMNNLSYKELCIQPYLVTDKLSLPQKQLIYRIRVRDVETPENYGRDVPCRLCFLARDEMSHILDCVVIKLACPAVYNNSDVKIADAHAVDMDMDRVKRLAIVFKEALRTREKLIDS